MGLQSLSRNFIGMLLDQRLILVSNCRREMRFFEFKKKASLLKNKVLLRISFKANNAAYFTNNAWKLCVVFWAGASGLVWREDKVCHDEESAVLCRRDDVIRLVPNPLVHPPHLRTRVETTRVRRQP